MSCKITDAMCDIRALMEGDDTLDPVTEPYDGPSFDPKVPGGWPPREELYEMAERTRLLIVKFKEGHAEREARYYALAERLALR